MYLNLTIIFLIYKLVFLIHKYLGVDYISCEIMHKITNMFHAII
jgi:hypothetical protein